MQRKKRDQMKKKYIVFCFVTLSVFSFFLSKHFYKIETNYWKEKLAFYISGMKQSGDHLPLLVYIWLSFNFYIEYKVDWRQLRTEVEKYCEGLRTNSSRHQQFSMAI